MEISSRKLFPLFRPGSVHSGLASWDDYDRVFPDSEPTNQPNKQQQNLQLLDLSFDEATDKELKYNDNE